MDWSIAKKTVIIILIVLNVCLFVLNRNEKDDFKISPAREKSAIEVLAKRDVYIYTDIIEDYSPKRKIKVKPITVTRESIEDTFFENEDIKISIEFDRNILKSDTKTVSYKGNDVIVYYNQSDEINENFNVKTAREQADLVLSQSAGKSNRFALLNTVENDGEYTFTYCEKYKGQFVYSSRYDITVNNKGVKTANIKFCEIEGYSDDKIEIYGADEALFTFSDFIGKSATVNRIEIVYDYPSDDNPDVDMSTKLVPYYFIFVMDRDQPYMVNAYTNKIK